MASQITRQIGRNLRRTRIAKRLTQRQLAELIGTDSFQLSRWERGAHRPKDETLQALGEALGVDWSAFYEPDEAAA